MRFSVFPLPYNDKKRNGDFWIIEVKWQYTWDDVMSQNMDLINVMDQNQNYLRKLDYELAKPIQKGWKQSFTNTVKPP